MEAREKILYGAVETWCDKEVQEGIPDSPLVLIIAKSSSEEKLLLESGRCLDSGLPRLVDSLPNEYVLWSGVFQDLFEQLRDTKGVGGWKHGWYFERPAVNDEIGQTLEGSPWRKIVLRSLENRPIYHSARTSFV